MYIIHMGSEHSKKIKCKWMKISMNHIKVYQFNFICIGYT